MAPANAAHTIFAGTSLGLYRGDDGGSSWDTAVAVDPKNPCNVCFLGLSNAAGFYKSTAAPAGMGVPSDKTYATATLPTVTINGVSATVYGAALAPGFAGLYQVAIQVPDSIANGDWPIQATIGGVKSPAGVLLTVHK